MVYGIIRRLRGTIDITSAVGVGTTFSIRLPIQAEAETGTEP
jgi:signal transduction histidine kinase